MILASFIDICINLVYVAQLIVTILLLVVVLMQRPKQEGLGAAFGSAITDQAFGARTTDVLKKATIYLGSLFMIIAFVLCVLMNRKYKENLPTLSQEATVQLEEGAQAQKDEPSVTDLLQQQQQKQQETPAPANEQPAPAPAPVENAPASEPAQSSQS